MSTSYKLDTGRHIEIDNTLTLVRIYSMDGKKAVMVSRKDIEAIRKELMTREFGKIYLHLGTGLNVEIFPNRVNIGIVMAGTTNSALLSAGEFIDIYSFINPLFAVRKADKNIIAAFFGSLFIR